MRFSDYRIKTRVYAGFGVLILLGGLNAAFGTSQLAKIDAQTARFVLVSGNVVRNLQVAQISERMRRLALRFSFPMKQ